MVHHFCILDMTVGRPLRVESSMNEEKLEPRFRVHGRIAAEMHLLQRQFLKKRATWYHDLGREDQFHTVISEHPIVTKSTSFGMPFLYPGHGSWTAAQRPIGMPFLCPLHASLVSWKTAHCRIGMAFLYLQHGSWKAAQKRATWFY